MKLFRVVDRPTEDGVRLYVYEFPVLKRTPRGYIIDDFGKRRFVLEDARKLYASPKIDIAWQSFVARKKRQISIYRSRLKMAELALELGDRRDTKSTLSYTSLID